MDYETDADIKKAQGDSDKLYFVVLAIFVALIGTAYIFAVMGAMQFSRNTWDGNAKHDLGNIVYAQSFTEKRVHHYGDSVEDINSISIALTKKGDPGINLIIHRDVKVAISTSESRKAYVTAVMSKSGNIYVRSSKDQKVKEYHSLDDYNAKAVSPIKSVEIPEFVL
jgi:hypothetical protein